MSAWIATDEHITAVVSFYVDVENKNRYSSERITVEDAVKMANTLKRQNYKSVNARYGENEKAAKITTISEYRPYDVSLMDAIKLAYSLDYQSCETDNYYATKAYKLLQTIIDTLSKRYIFDTHEWETAKWSY